MKRSIAGVVAALTLASGTVARGDELERYVPSAAELVVSQQLERIAEASSKSSDLRLRIVYSMSGDVAAERQSDGNGFDAVERIPAATLYADARGSTDPLLLDLLLQRCSHGTKTRNACDRLDVAARWTAVDAQNQLAWVTLATVRKERGDITGARAAFVRAADAPRWHSHETDVAQLIARSAPSSLSPTMQNAFLGDAIARGWSVLPFAAFQTLGDYCREEGEVRAACARILAVLIRDSDSVVGLNLAAPFAARAHVDPLVIRSYEQQTDALMWALQHDGLGGDLADEVDPDAQRRLGNELRTLIALGERRRADGILLALGVTPSDAAARYVSTLPPSVLARRAERYDAR